MGRTARSTAIAALLAACVGVGVATAVAAPAPTGRAVLDKALSLQEGVRDYVCVVTVKTNFPNIRMPERRMKVFAKLPGKLRVESGGQIVVAPRDALLLGNLRKHLTKDVRLVLAGQSASGGRPVYCVKIVPAGKGQNARQDRLVVYVWGDNWTLKRTEMWAGPNRILSADWRYVQVQGHWLPSRIHADVGGGQVAQGEKGTVDMAFSDWNLNVGLDDKIFVEPPKPNRPRHRFHRDPDENWGPPLD
jgi:hypothetical protein